MKFSLLDFLIGFALMNAMPHLLFGLLRIRFLSVFGFGPRGNIAYSFLNIAFALFLFHTRYGLSALMEHGIVLGVGAVWFIYLISGKFFHNLFQKGVRQ